MLIKATHFHPGELLQVYMVGVVVAEAVVDVVVAEVAVNGTAVVEAEEVGWLNMVVKTEVTV